MAFGIVYKITNKENGKVYIGQTVCTLARRMNNHFSDAKRDDREMYADIRRLGRAGFDAEVLCECDSKDELNEQEIHWIAYYRNIDASKVYNIYDGGSWDYLSDDEVADMRKQISDNKLYGNNPMSTKVKAKNIETGEILHFESFSACQEYFGDKNHNFITRRVEGKTTFAYRNTWIFAYEDGEFSENFKREKSIARKRPIRVTTKDGEVYEFTSYTNMEKHFGLKRCSIGGKVYMKRKKFGSTFDISGYHIEEL